jgi:hypothetical protein
LIIPGTYYRKAPVLVSLFSYYYNKTLRLVNLKRRDFVSFQFWRFKGMALALTGSGEDFIAETSQWQEYIGGRDHRARQEVRAQGRGRDDLPLSPPTS